MKTKAALFCVSMSILLGVGGNVEDQQKALDAIYAQIVKDSGKNCGKISISACDPNDQCESTNCPEFYATLKEGDVTLMFVLQM